MAFTALGIKKLKKKKTRYDEWEGNNRGFGIRVYPTGAKTWLYKYTLNGKRETLLLGKQGDQEPKLSLDAARTIHAEKEALVNKGINPKDIKKEQRRQQLEAPTVTDLANKFINKATNKRNEPLRPKTIAEYKRLLENDLLDEIGWMKVAEVKRRHIRDIIEGVEQRAGNAARQLFKVTRRMFNYAVEIDWIEVNPMASMSVMGSEGKKDRNLTPDEILVFWKSLQEANMSDDLQRALKLILVTAQRPGEVLGSHSSEFEGDWWTIPSERTKNKRSHTVYLTEQAKELFRLNDRPEGFLFPSPRKDKAIAVNALSKALRRSLTVKNTGKVSDETQSKPSIPIEPSFTPHDLRRTAATQTAKLGFGVFVDKVLNHSDGRVTAIYDRYEYDKEKQQALEAWGNRLTEIIHGKQIQKKPQTRKQQEKKTAKASQMSLF